MLFEYCAGPRLGLDGALSKDMQGGLCARVGRNLKLPSV